MTRRAGSRRWWLIVTLGLLPALPAWAAPPPAADAAPCQLQTERDRIVDEHLADNRRIARGLKGLPPERAGETIWLKVRFQPSCVDLAMRWLVDTKSPDNRVAAASYLWFHREAHTATPV